MLFKNKPSEIDLHPGTQLLTAAPQVSAATATQECPAAEQNGASITVSHGIHHKDFPVAGMTVSQVRRTLASLLNIDPKSVAVINGQIVKNEDSRIVKATDHLLSFVKENSIRG